VTQPDEQPPTPEAASDRVASGDTCTSGAAGSGATPVAPLPVPVHTRVAGTGNHTDDPTVVIRRLTRLGLGALLASGEATRRALGTDASPSTLTDAGLGALALAREASLAAGKAATGAARQAATAVDPVVRQVADHPAVAPLVASGRSGMSNVIDALSDAGRAERHRASEESSAVVRRSVNAAVSSDLLPDAAQALASGTLPETLDAVLPGVVDRLSRDPDLLVGLVNGVMEKLAEDPDALTALAERLIDPVINQALPVTLEALNDEGDAISRIVRTQSGGLADEMANSFRSRGVTADDAVDRVVSRIKRPWRSRARRQAGSTSP